MDHTEAVAVREGASLAWRVINDPDVVREELLAYLPTAPADEVAATRQQLVDLGIALRSRGNAEVLRLARLTEWEMARRWPVKAGTGRRDDDRPRLSDASNKDAEQWSRIYEVGRAPLDRILSESEPSRLTQAQVMKWGSVQDIADVTPVNPPQIETDLRFGVIYADPPWRYGNMHPQGTPENHYPTMALEDICSLDVPSDDDCVLYLWATAPLLVEALQVLNSWGFTYKTSAVWDKVSPGIGYWWRGQHEHLLVGVRGKVSPPPARERVASVYRESRRQHSRKPDIIRTQIGSWFPEALKLEMFCRYPAPGWHAWGNQVDSSLSTLPVEAFDPNDPEITGQYDLLREVAP